MSELSLAISKLKVCNIPGNPERRKQIKDAFRAGWEAREISLNKRVAEIEKSATLKERERCVGICQNLVINHPGFADLTADQCAEEIRSGK